MNKNNTENAENRNHRSETSEHSDERIKSEPPLSEDNSTSAKKEYNITKSEEMKATEEDDEFKVTRKKGKKKDRKEDKKEKK